MLNFFKKKTGNEPAESSTNIPEVRVIVNKEEFRYAVLPDQNILEAGLNKDIDMPYSCRSGVCSTCRGKLIAGKVKMDETHGLSDDELDKGYVLTCQSHPLTDDVLIEIG